MNVKNPRPNDRGFVMYTQGIITFFIPFYISIAAMSPALLPYPLQKWSELFYPLHIHCG